MRHRMRLRRFFWAVCSLLCKSQIPHRIKRDLHNLYNTALLQRWLAAVLLLSGCTPLVAPATAPAITVTPTVTGSATVATAITATATSVTMPTVGAKPQAQATGRSIDIGGRTLFLVCTGEKTPTVLLEAGLGADHTSWDQVQAAVAPVARVCSYDRAGVGQSAPAPIPRTSADVVQDLHHLLQEAGESGPYILVGHSFGGLHMRLFAHDYVDEVLGMILVDAVHEEWWVRAAALLPPATAHEDAQLHSFRRYVTVDYADPTQTAEGIDIPATAQQLQQASALGDMPLLVLVAGVPMLGDAGLPPALTQQLTQLLQETLPVALTNQSSQSLRITVDNSGHNIPQEQPDVVVAAIRTLLDVVCPGEC